MSTYIIAQIIGTVGYFFYIAAPNFKTQTRVMQVEALACVICCIQWFLLDQMSVFAVNALTVGVTYLALVHQNKPLNPIIIQLTYLFSCIFILSLSKNTIVDFVALTGFSFLYISKFSQDLIRFRMNASISGTCSMVAGLFSASLPAVIFNAIFTLGHIKELTKTRAFLTYHSESSSA